MAEEIDWSDEAQRTEYLQNQIRSGVDEEAAGLKNKNQELLDKLAALKGSSEKIQQLESTIQSLGGEDGVKKLIELKDKISSDERMSKLMSGEISQIQEVIDAETTAMRSNYENQISSLKQRAESAEQNSETLRGTIRDSQLQSLVNQAVQELGCLPGTAPEVFRHALEVFVWDAEKNCHVIKENDVVKLGGDGKAPMTISEWLDSTRESAAYRWPASKGGGASGSGPGGNQSVINTDNMPMGEYRKLRKAGQLT